MNHTPQLDAMDCGPACLKMITDYHGRVVSLQKLREKCHILCSTHYCLDLFVGLDITKEITDYIIHSK